MSGKLFNEKRGIITGVKLLGWNQSVLMPNSWAAARSEIDSHKTVG
jgi:hypothetical protein